MQKVILHIDMNSYFASVEQQANPFLRGKPLGVCAYLPKTKNGNGCIIASSMEAKKVGVKTGMRISDAKKIYPGIILVQNEPSKYRSTTEKIFSILAQYTDRVEPYSIDEAFLDMTGWVRELPQAELLARQIQRRIKTEVGDWLQCSVGVSSTRFLAKFGSDVAPKGGVLMVTPDTVAAIFSRVRITDAWGIKHKTAWRLWRLGIATLNDLRRYPVANLIACLGKPGYYLWANVNGVELSDVATTPAAPKSIGHSYCLPKRTDDPAYLRPILAKLCERTGRRLRSQNLEARGIFAYCGLQHGHGRGGSKRAAEPLFTTPDILRAANALLFSRPLPDAATQLAVSVTDLQPTSGQQSLFDDILKPKLLAAAADRLNDKYGESTIASGAMWGTTDNAHDRVGYRKTISIPASPPTTVYIPE
ncbi:MAG: DNA polymerase IV [Parcubacteria group bacterium Gr01-1014_31]|nr:MAG: DNA polymerase IV [Parcubacteria group bacterium Gr01-1014_31]